ncbi:MAG TPA: DUF262 domain-containing protein [Rubrobacteraceae bacterium]|nr:DUF262 domain-containing protein [Rubrobacteraceae bacterium]
MKATGTRFSSLLQGQQHFVVPLFQRPYLWKEKDWRTLFDDVLEIYEEGLEDRHFVGSIVTKSLGATPEGVSPFLVIDGQQRLTTLTLLLAALRDLSKETDPTLSNKIHKLYLTNEFASSQHRYKVLPTQVNRAAYAAVIDDAGTATGAPAGGPPGGKVDEDPNLPLYAYRYFVKRLRENSIGGEPIAPTRLEQVLVGALEVVSITLEDSDNEYRIFESLNGTGTPLAQVDLIRNYFFMRLPLEKHEDLYHEAWLPMQESLSGSLDLFFRHAYASSGQFVRESDVYRAWKDRLDPVPVAELAEQLRYLAREAENYRKLLVPEEEHEPRVSRGLSRLNRWGGQTAYPFLLNVYRLYASGEVSPEEVAEVLGILESYLVRRFFARVHTRQLNRLFMRLYQQLPEGVGLAEGIRTVLSEPSRRWPRDEDFREGLMRLPLYTEGRYEQRHLVLETLEESFGSKEPVDLPALTIEHVMPQALTKEWVQALGADAREHHQRTMHRLGNLTLTGYNPELSNGPFPAKREKLAQSNVQMNKEIACEKEWGFRQIEERGRRLAERAIRIWPGPAQPQMPETAPRATLPPTDYPEGQNGAPPPVQNNGGWTDEELRDALENSTRAMGVILPYLAERPGQRVDSQVLAELVYGKGASPRQLGGTLASFTRRIKSRYGRDSWPFEAIRNEEKGLWEYRMDAYTAEKIRGLKTSAQGSSAARG